MAREMKDSGLLWLGQIPSDWRMKKLKFSCQMFGRIGFRGYTAEDLVGEGEGAITLSPTNMDGIKMNYEKCSFLRWDKYYESPEIMVRNGDVLLVKTASVGKCSFVENLPMETTVNPQILVLKKHKDCAKFIAYLFQTAIGTYYIDTTKGGSTIYTISQEKIGNYLIPFPPLSEQQAIADFLDAKCAEIDGLLADLDAEVKTLAEYKKSIIAETVTRGLNRNVPMKQSGLPWVGEIPNHWKVIANKYIMHKKKDIVPIYEGQDIISLSMNGVIVRDLDAGGKMPTTFNGYQHIYPGNLLMCLFDIDVTPRCIGLIKNDGLTSPAYSQFVMDGDAYAPYYYYFYLKMDNEKELVHLSKNMRHSLNEEQFGMIKTIFPPKEEQEAIAAYLDEKCAIIDKSIADKQTQIETLKSYKASLIYEYVTGKKQVI